MTDLDIEEFKRELLIASDVRSFIELLQRVFDEESAERGLTKSDLASLVERDLSYVSRVINGRQKNVSLPTLVLFMRAMGRRLEPSESKLINLGAQKPNYRILPTVVVGPSIGPGAFSTSSNAKISDGDAGRNQTYSPKAPVVSLVL